MSLSESWSPRLALQSFCSQGSSVCVVSLRPSLGSETEASAATPSEEVSVCLALHGDALCAARIADEEGDEDAVESRRGKDEDEQAKEFLADGEKGLPSYLLHPSFGPCRLTDPEMEEGVCAFSACAGPSFSSTTPNVSSSCEEAFVLTCGASGLLRLRLLSLKDEREREAPGNVKALQLQSSDASVQIAAQRLLQTQGEASQTLYSSVRVPWLELREVQKWKGPSSVARVVRFSPFYKLGTSGGDSGAQAFVRLAAVGFVGGELEVFAVRDGGCSSVVSLKGEGAVTAMDFHPSRALLAVGSAEGGVRVWDFSAAVLVSLQSGGPSSADCAVALDLKDHLSAVSALLFLDDEASRKLASSSVKGSSAGCPSALLSAAGDSLVNFWRLEKLPQRAGLLSGAEKNSSADARSRKQSVALQRRLSQETTRPEFCLPALEMITALLLPTVAAPLLMTGGAQGVLKMWDLRTRKLLQTESASSRACVRAMQTAPTACALPVKSDASQEDPGLFIRSLQLLPRSAESAGGKRLLVAQDSGLLTLSALAAKRGEPKLLAFTGPPRCLLGRLDDVFTARFLPPPPPACSCPCCRQRRAEARETAERNAVSAGYPSSLVALTGDPVAWRVSLSEGFPATPVGATRSALGGREDLSLGHSAAVTCVDVSKNGCWIVTGSRDGSLCVWHVALNRLVFRVEEAHANCLTAVAFQRKKWTNASPLFREEGTEGRQCLCDCRGLSASNSHHLLLASACDAHNVKLWRFRIPTDLFESDKVLQKGESLLASVVAHKKEINDLQFAPNDSMICTASQDKTVKVLAVPSLATLAELRGHRRAVYSLQFASREKILATVSGDSTLKLWNLDTFSCVKTLQGAGPGILCVRFLNLDSQLLTADSEGLVHLWNARTSECCGAMPHVHQDKVWCMDTWGQALVTGGADGQLCIWKDVSEEVRAERRRSALREQQEMTAVKALESTDRVSDVFIMLVRMKKKFALAEFLKRRFARGLVDSLDRDNPAACARRGCVRSLRRFLPTELRDATPRARAVLAKLGLSAAADKAVAAEADASEPDGSALWKEAVASLDVTQAKTLLSFVVDWNADPATSWLAQGMLHLLLRHFSLDELAGEGVAASLGGKPTADVVEALMVFAERHERRISGLLQKSFLLDLLRPGAASVQQEVEDLVSALDGQGQAPSDSSAAETVKPAKKRRVEDPSRQRQGTRANAKTSKDANAKTCLVAPEFLSQHFGSIFTEQCLYGDA